MIAHIRKNIGGHRRCFRIKLVQMQINSHFETSWIYPQLWIFPLQFLILKILFYTRHLVSFFYKNTSV
jgi:hypothetical protein